MLNHKRGELADRTTSDAPTVSPSGRAWILAVSAGAYVGAAALAVRGFATAPGAVLTRAAATVAAATRARDVDRGRAARMGGVPSLS